MTIWLINGYTKEVGLWEVELFTDKSKAEEMFKYYVGNYNAEVSEDDEWFAMCRDGIGRFYLEEREI